MSKKCYKVCPIKRDGTSGFKEPHSEVVTRGKGVKRPQRPRNKLDGPWCNMRKVDRAMIGERNHLDLYGWFHVVGGMFLCWLNPGHLPCVWWKIHQKLRPLHSAWLSQHAAAFQNWYLMQYFSHPSLELTCQDKSYDNCIQTVHTVYILKSLNCILPKQTNKKNLLFDSAIWICAI